jgi:predicted NUDIX family NTP pyrophosphohydrolase
MKEKKVSSCVIIFNPEKNEILAEHPYGRPWKTKDGQTATGTFSLPKGEIDENEDKFDAAVREIKEETGIKLDKKKLKYLGKYAYIDYKDLEMFFYLDDGIDIKKCKCDSFFEGSDGKIHPEVNGYAWANVESELNVFFYSLQKVIKKVLVDWKELFNQTRLQEQLEETATELVHKIAFAISDWSLIFQEYWKEIRPFWKSLEESMNGDMQLRALQLKTKEIYDMALRLKDRLKDSHLIPEVIKGELFTISDSIVPEIFRIYASVFKNTEMYDDKDRENVHREVFKFKQVYDILRSIINAYNQKWAGSKYVVENLGEIDAGQLN